VCVALVAVGEMRIIPSLLIFSRGEADSDKAELSVAFRYRL
jgi:hypothetical protein